MNDRLIGIEHDEDNRRYRWICECGRHGRWTAYEDKASRAMVMHDYKHRLAEHANQERQP